jgi:hypothetical protein
MAEYWWGARTTLKAAETAGDRGERLAGGIRVATVGIDLKALADTLAINL